MPFIATPNPEGGSIYSLQDTNHRFPQPPTSLSTSDPRRAAFEKSLKAVGDFEDTRRAILSDEELSATGRARKLDPARVNVVTALASNFADLNDIDASAAAAERQALTPPPVDPSNVSAATREATVLQWWGGLSVIERAAVQQQMVNEPEAHEETMLAILHAPPAMRNAQSDEVLGYWQNLQRKRNPEKLASIAEARDAVEWSRRGVAQLTGVANRLLDWKPEQTLAALASADKPRGFELFGFDQRAVNDMSQRIKHALTN